MRVLSRIPLILFILSVPPFLAAQEGPVTVASRVDKSLITIGDLIRYTVTVTHMKGVNVRTPGTGANLGGFEIRDYKVLDPKEQKGSSFRSINTRSRLFSPASSSFRSFRSPTKSRATPRSASWPRRASRSWWKA